MSKRLSTEDGHAIDLLLERPDGAAGRSLVEMVFADPVESQFESRLDAAEKVLSLLDSMPAAEPSDDLVRRTMQRIEQAQRAPGAAQAPAQSAGRATRPQA